MTVEDALPPTASGVLLAVLCRTGLPLCPDVSCLKVGWTQYESSCLYLLIGDTCQSEAITLTAFESEGTGPFHPWHVAGSWTNVFLCHVSLPLPVSISSSFLLVSSQSAEALSTHPFKVHTPVSG